MELADLKPPGDLRDAAHRAGLGLAKFRGSRGPRGRARQGPIAANRELTKHTIRNRLGEPIGAGGRVVGSVGSEHRLRAALLDHPVQVVDGHAQLAHDRDRCVVVPPHVGLGPIELRTSPSVPLVQDGGRVGEDQCGIGALADSGNDPAQILGVAIELDLMVPVGLGSLQVVQAAVQMDDVWLLAEHPLVEVGEHVRAVAAILRRADDDGLAHKPFGDPWGVAQSDRIADEHHLGEPGPGEASAWPRAGMLAVNRPAMERRIRTPDRIVRLRMRRQFAVQRRSVSIPGLLVHDVQQHLARGEPPQVLAEELVRAPLAAGRLAGRVRRDDHVSLPERMTGRERFRVGHVQAGRGDLALVQRSDQAPRCRRHRPRETLIRIVPRFIIPNSFSPIIFLDRGVSGTALATTSARGKRRWNASGLCSSSTKSGFSNTFGSVASTRIPKPKALRAISLPMPPRAMTSSVFP